MNKTSFKNILLTTLHWLNNFRFFIDDNYYVLTMYTCLIKCGFVWNSLERWLQLKNSETLYKNYFFFIWSSGEN